MRNTIGECPFAEKPGTGVVLLICLREVEVFLSSNCPETSRAGLLQPEFGRLGSERIRSLATRLYARYLKIAPETFGVKMRVACFQQKARLAGGRVKALGESSDDSESLLILR